MWDRELRSLILAHENNKRRGAIFTLHFEISRFGVGRVPTACELYFCVGSLHFTWSIHPSSARVRRGRSVDKRVRNGRKCFRSDIRARARVRTAPDGHPAFRKYFRGVDTGYVSLSIRRVSHWNRIFHSRFGYANGCIQEWSKQEETERKHCCTSIALWNKYSLCLQRIHCSVLSSLCKWMLHIRQYSTIVRVKFHKTRKRASIESMQTY